MPRKAKKLYEYIDRAAISRLAGEPLLSSNPMEGSVSGHHRSNHKGSSVEFAEYREYTPGEDPRRMDWRVLGRTDRYFLKEFEAETNLRCHCILDASGSMGFGEPENKLEFGKRLIATLTYLYLRQGDAVGLEVPTSKSGPALPARRNPAQLQAVLETLGKTKAKGADLFAEKLHLLAEGIRMRALGLLISDFLEEPHELANAIHHLRNRKHEVALFHIMDRQEIDFPFDRPTRFLDLEGGSPTLTEPSVIRRQYLEQLEAHSSSLRKVCTETQSSYHQVITDQGVERALSGFSMERTRT